MSGENGGMATHYKWLVGILLGLLLSVASAGAGSIVTVQPVSEKLEQHMSSDHHPVTQAELDALHYRMAGIEEQLERLPEMEGKLDLILVWLSQGVNEVDSGP